MQLHTAGYRLSVIVSAVLLFATVVGLPAAALAEVPETLVQQGRLLDDEGEPVTGTHELTFSIYDAETGGAILWEGTATVEVSDSGFYTAELGSEENPISPSVLAGDVTWLGVAVDGSDELSPRTKLDSVPYALLASRAQSVAPGAVTDESLAEDFQLDGSSVDAINWSQIEGTPIDIADGDQDTLGGMSCESGQVAKFDGSNWTCADTADGNDFAVSDQNCEPGDVVTGIDESGNVVCKNDPVADQSCGDGKVAIGLEADGSLLCETDQTRSDAEIEGVIADQNAYATKDALPQKMRINRDGQSLGGDGQTVISYVDPSGSSYDLTITDAGQCITADHGKMAYCNYELYFNIEGAPLSCSLFSREDDTPSNNYSVRWATDSGNCCEGVWGTDPNDDSDRVQTFRIGRQGSTGVPIDSHTGYSIVCM